MESSLFMIKTSMSDNGFTYQDGTNMEGLSVEGIASGLLWRETDTAEMESMLDTKNVIANGLQQEDGMDTEDAGNSDFRFLLY